MTQKEEQIVAAIWGSETPRFGNSVPVVTDRKDQKNLNLLTTAKLTASKFQKKQVS